MKMIIVAVLLFLAGVFAGVYVMSASLGEPMLVKLEKKDRFGRDLCAVRDLAHEGAIIGTWGQSDDGRCYMSVFLRWHLLPSLLGME